MAKLNSIDLQESEIGIYFKFKKEDSQKAIDLFRKYAGKDVWKDDLLDEFELV